MMTDHRSRYVDGCCFCPNGAVKTTTTSKPGLGGHSTSLEMTPCDRWHRTSY